MSDGPRIPLAVAEHAALQLRQFWSLPEEAVFVGSLRRRRDQIGDLDLIAPAVAPGAVDPLYLAIDKTLEKEGSLFSAIKNPLGVAIRGHKPGFRAAAYTLRLANPNAEIPLQISRYTPENLGWQLIYRTGPREFGMGFLVLWKQAFGIAKERQASIDGHLVDDFGRIVPVPTEEDAFRLCRLTWIRPEDRDKAAQGFIRRFGMQKE